MRNKRSRFLYMLIVGVGISFLLHFLLQVKNDNHKPIYDLIASAFITILIWEGNLRIDNLLNKKFPWVSKPGKRILVHLPVSVIYSAAVIYFCMLTFSKYFCDLPSVYKDLLMSSAIVIGVLVSIIILSIEISTQFFMHWKKSIVEVEKYKTESLQAQLQNLKNQLNPHFLFNNLSVLSSLVYKDQDKAVDFINQLSKVYRYLLDNQDNELVTLQNELTFIHSYVYLLKIRFGKNIIFVFEIATEKLTSLIPPLSLQMLVENAIKHNEISSAHPLTIRVKTTADTLEVRNNLQLRTDNEISSKTGLQNIKDRYNYFTATLIEVIQNNHSFIVKIPLLQTK